MVVLILTKFIPSASDMTSGLPFENAKFTWDIRTMDDQPLTTDRLAEKVRAVDGELQLYGLKASSKFAKARCLANLPTRDAPQEGEPKKRLPFYVSPVVKFHVTPKEGEPIPTEPRIGKLTELFRISVVTSSYSL